MVEEMNAMINTKGGSGTGPGSNYNRTVGAVPGFGYSIKPTVKKTAEELDKLRRNDLGFWQKLGNETSEPWEIVEVRGRRVMVSFLCGEVETAIDMFLQGRVDTTVRDCKLRDDSQSLGILRFE